MSPPRAGPDFSLHPRSTYTLLDPRSLKTIKLFQTTTFQIPFPSTFYQPISKPNTTKPSRCNSRSSLSLPPWLPSLLLNRRLFVIFNWILDANVRPRTVYVTVPCSTASVIKGHPSPTIASTGVRKTPTPTGSPIAHVTGAASVNAVSGSALGLIIAGGVALVSSVTLLC